jgi:ELWxxDGT repeat protein
MRTRNSLIRWILRFLLLGISIPLCLLAGCSAYTIGYATYWNITAPARKATLIKVAARHVIDMDNYTLFILTFENADYHTWWELWRSDGTTSGTQLVKKGFTGGDDQRFTDFVRQDTVLLFASNGVEHEEDARSWKQGVTLWQTDGTPEGTTVVRGMSPGSSWPNNFVRKHQAIYFYANEYRAEGTYCSIWKGTGASAATFTAQRIDQGILNQECRGLEEAPALQPLPGCIQWQHVVLLGENRNIMIACAAAGVSLDNGALVARVNADHTVTIVRQTKDNQMIELRTIP